MKILDSIEIDLVGDHILDTPPLSKWTQNEKSRDKIENLLDEWGEKVESRTTVKAVYDILRREETDIEEYSPPEPILEAELLAVGIVTIKNRFEENTEKPESALENLVVDALENIALNQGVEKTVENIEGKVEKDELKLSRVLSPGSGRINWDIENQEFIYKNLEPEKIDVQLTSTGSLKPSKSVSFLIGLGENLDSPENLFSCEGCSRADCPYRVE